MSGVMFYELAHNLKSFQSGSEQYKLRFYVGHDGSMIRLASGNVAYSIRPSFRTHMLVCWTGLGLGKDGPLRWPAMGSEIVLEVISPSTSPPQSSLTLLPGVAYGDHERLCACDARGNTSPVARMGGIRQLHRNTRTTDSRQHLWNLYRDVMRPSILSTPTPIVLESPEEPKVHDTLQPVGRFTHRNNKWQNKYYFLHASGPCMGIGHIKEDFASRLASCARADGEWSVGMVSFDRQQVK
jgi:hypothetical protein